MVPTVAALGRRAAARAGLVVVSGMARGLDAVAHAGGARGRRGTTIGVLGNGLGVVYPAANRALYDRVFGGGLLITEFPPGERPHAGSFPRRNRLISGLARVTVVVEAAVGSGALITAGTALDQGREVMAVPGPITSPVSIGANRLIRDGATPYLELADLASSIPRPRSRRTPACAATGPTRLPDTPDQDRARGRRAAGCRGHAPRRSRRARAGDPVGELLAALCRLELHGVVEQAPGRLFRRV